MIDYPMRASYVGDIYRQNLYGLDAADADCHRQIFVLDSASCLYGGKYVNLPILPNN